MDAQQAAPSTLAFVKATLAAGTTSTLSSTGTIVYSIRGKAHSASALSNTATPTTDWSTLAAFTGVTATNGCVFMVGLNAAGALKCVQGTITPLDVSGAFVVAPQFGGLPLDFCPIGYIVIKAGATANATTGWVFGTNNMASVTGITYTFVDVVGMPDRPQIS
jgi:hypothetical protein